MGHDGTNAGGWKRNLMNRCELTLRAIHWCHNELWLLMYDALAYTLHHISWFCFENVPLWVRVLSACVPVQCSLWSFCLYGDQTLSTLSWALLLPSTVNEASGNEHEGVCRHINSLKFLKRLCVCVGGGGIGWWCRGKKRVRWKVGLMPLKR